jgi:hypothetical protein
MGGGLPVEPIQRALRRIGKTAVLPPSPDAASMDNLVYLWANAGLIDIETQLFETERIFPSLDDFWTINGSGPTARHFASLTSDEADEMKAYLRETLDIDPSGRVRCQARANAIKGRVPA